MNETQERNIGRSGTRRRWPWVVMIMLIFLVTLARLALKSDFVHSWVRDQITLTISTMTDARLEIGSVSGDLFREIRLTDLRVIRGDTVLRVDTLYAGYRVFTYFQPEFQIDEISVVRPAARIDRNTEGAWNIPRLAEGSSGSEPGSPFLFNISRFTLSDGDVTVHAGGAGIDSVFVINDLLLEGGFRYLGENYNLNLRELGFNIEETRLNDPVSVRSSLQADDRSITLERLIIATGSSMLQSTGSFNAEDSAAAFGLNARPLSFRDLSAYSTGVPVDKNLEIDLNLSGNMNAFNIILEAEADGLEGVMAEGAFSWGERLALESLDFRAEALRLDTFFGDDALPAFERVRSSGTGTFLFSEVEQSVWSGDLFAQVTSGPFSFIISRGNFNLDAGRLNGGIRVDQDRQWIDVRLESSSIWSGTPAFRIVTDAGNIDPFYWAQNPEASGAVNFRAELEGEGFRPGEGNWNYTLSLNDSRIAGQEIAAATLSGNLDSSRASIQSTFSNERGVLEFRATIEDYLTSAPGFSFNLEVDTFNLAGYPGFENVTTLLNGTIQGGGRYFSADSLQLTSTIRIDSSIVNNEYVDEIQAEVRISDNIIYLSNTQLRSAIADGSFDARIYLADLYDTGNRLSLDMQIKDIRSLAPLLGPDRLETTGTVTGVVNPLEDSNRLQFIGSVSLTDLIYNDLLTSQEVTGDVEIELTDSPAYTLNLMLNNPVIHSIVLQDVSTSVRGNVDADSTWGDYQLMFRSASSSEIRLAGSYGIGESQTLLRTSEFRIISDLRTLALRQPFDIRLADLSFQMDTVRIDSDDGASLEMAIPYADSLNQRGYIEGENLNMTVIQNTLLNQAWFEGILSGRIYLDRNGTTISSTGDLNIRDIAYRGLELDSLRFDYRLGGERLEGGLDLYDGNELLAEGELNVPFKLGDPEAFEEAFFEEEIYGHLRTNTVPASRFSGFLEPLGATNTDGQLRISILLDGQAGQPEMEASASLREATLSGVAVDSLIASFSYSHVARVLAMDASVVSLRQRAAEVTAEIPLYVDLRNFMVELPDEDDRLRMQITTDRFNLASLNDFVNRTRFREIGGTLDGAVTITGSPGALAASGELNFRNGAIRIVEAGIRVDNIQSDFIFEEDTVHLQRLSARSGNGTFQADGTMELARLRPGDMDINMTASNFRLANTSQYSAIINMNTRLGGTLFRPHLEGSMDFVSGFIYLQNFGERSVETVDLNQESAPGYDYYVSYDSLSLDMDVSFNRRFFVRNRRFLDLEYELEGQIDLQKQSGDTIALFGSLSAVGGYARPLGKRFQLVEGVITFEGDPSNPLLNIRHLFEPPQEDMGDVQIWYVIEGSIEDPRFMYESNPPMGLEDIISYTLFGRPFSSLNSWRQVVANSGSSTSPASVAMEVLLDRVETLATRRLGIDVVQIDNTGSGGNTGTSIKTGWYLNSKTFFAIQNEIAGSGPETIFTLEYLLKRNLKLIITQGSDSQTGVDLRWKLDY